MNIASMVSSYNRSQKRKSVISSDDSLISASDLSKEWGLSYIATCEEIKRLRIPLAFNIANEKFYDMETCNKKMPFLSECKIIKPEKKEVESMDKNEELQKWLNDDRYVQVKDLRKKFDVGEATIYSLFKRYNIKPKKRMGVGASGGLASFYNKKKCDIVLSEYKAMQIEIQKMQENFIYVSPKELTKLWDISYHSAHLFLKRQNIQPVKSTRLGRTGGTIVFYDRAECERARPFINQPEKEVEKVEQVNLPEPKEQTPDIIPADTIDLFTMSELESELKQRGVELTDEVKAKINASDMPEMQHIATMIRGNAKSIAIRLSVLNEIAGQLRDDNSNAIKDSKISMTVHTNDGRIEKYCLNAELRPCVLCGGDNLAVDAEESQNDNWHASVLCLKCGDSSVCADDSSLHDVMDALIDNWQKKHDMGNDSKNDKMFDCNYWLNGVKKRPTAGAKVKYTNEFDIIARNMTRESKTHKEIYERLRISADTFYSYIKQYPSFANALSPEIETQNPSESFELKDLTQMQKQINEIQQTIDSLAAKLSDICMVKKTVYMKNGKVTRVIMEESKI